MILIPVFLFSSFFQFKRYKDGLKSFKVDFITMRKRVLDSVHQSLTDNTSIDIDELVAAGNAPARARDAYGAWINELVVFYRSLLEAEGSDYPSLVQSCYRKRSNYLLALNRLNTVERDLNRARLPELDHADERTNVAIEAIEKSISGFRRNQVKEVFSR